MTGIAFGWIGATTASGSVVRKANSGLSASSANHSPGDLAGLWGPRRPTAGGYDLIMPYFPTLRIMGNTVLEVNGCVIVALGVADNTP